MSKVMVIGLDGGTFDVLDPMLQKGLMPNLQEIIESGVRGELISTVPPVTAPAWTSFWTGKNPGKHGVYNFLQKVQADADFSKSVFVNASHIRTPTLFDILNEKGKKLTSINVPLTYPPQKTNGIVVSGLLAPNTSCQYTYPAEFKKTIAQKVGDYPIAVEWTNYTEDQISIYIDELIKALDKRTQTFLIAMDESQPDLSAIVYSETDSIQHSLWDIVDPKYSGVFSSKWESYKQHVESFYNQLDMSIGKILKNIDDDTNLFFMSDHGFGPIIKHVNLDKVLIDNGLMEYERNNIITRHFNSATRILNSCINKLTGATPTRLGSHLLNKELNLAKTKAYCISKMIPGIYLTDLAKHDNTIANKIVDTLLQLKDLENGQNVFKAVYKKDQIYHGEFLDFAPDILYLANKGYYIVATGNTGSQIERCDKWGFGRGTHLENGIFIASGSNIKKRAKIDNSSIIDIAPTLLYALGLPVPSDMDGKVLSDAFDGNYIKNHPVKISEPPSFAQTSSSDDENEEIEKRLKGLGYL